MGIFKKAMEATQPERDAMKQAAAEQAHHDVVATYGAAIDQTLDADLLPEVKELLLRSHVDTRASELNRAEERFR